MYRKRGRLTLSLDEDDESESNDIRVNEMKIWGHKEVIQRLHSIGTVQDEIYQLASDSLLGPPVHYKKIWADVKDEVWDPSSIEYKDSGTSPFKAIDNHETPPTNNEPCEKSGPNAITEINHLPLLELACTSSDETTNDGKGSVSHSSYESKLEAEPDAATREWNDQDPLTLSESDKQRSTQIYPSSIQSRNIVSEINSEEMQCQSLPKGTFELESSQKTSESVIHQNLVEGSASESSVGEKNIEISLDSSSRCEAYQKTCEVQKNLPQGNVGKEKLVKIRYIVEGSPKFSIRKMKKVLRNRRKRKLFGRKWNPGPKMVRKRKLKIRKSRPGKPMMSSTTLAENTEAQQPGNTKMDGTPSSDLNLQHGNEKQPLSDQHLQSNPFNETPVPQESSVMQIDEDPQELAKLSPTHEVVKKLSDEETCVQISMVPENLHEEPPEQETQQLFEDESVERSSREITKSDTSSQTHNLLNTSQVSESQNDSNSSVEVDNTLLAFTTHQNEPPLDSVSADCRKEPLNLSSMTATVIPTDHHSNNVENSALTSGSFNDPTGNILDVSVSTAIKNVCNSDRRKVKIDENGLPLKVSRVLRSSKKSSLLDEPSLKERNLSGQDIQDNLTPNIKDSPIELAGSTSKTKPQRKRKKQIPNSTEIDIKSQPNENLDPDLRSDLPDLPEKDNSIESPSKIFPELSSLSIQKTLQFGSILKDTELSSSFQEIDENEVSINSVSKCNPKVIEKTTIFCVSKITQQYSIHKILPCICDQTQTSNPILPDSCSNKEKGDVALRFCLNCIIFEEAITVEKVNMLCCGSAFICSICSFKATKKAFLLDHVTFSHPKVVFQCPSCEFQAEFDVHLKHHWDQTHANLTHL